MSTILVSCTMRILIISIPRMISIIFDVIKLQSFGETSFSIIQFKHHLKEIILLSKCKYVEEYPKSFFSIPSTYKNLIYKINFSLHRYTYLPLKANPKNILFVSVHIVRHLSEYILPYNCFPSNNSKLF